MGSASNPIVIHEDWCNEIDRASSVADTEIATPESSKTVIDESFPNPDEDEAIGSSSVHASTTSSCEDLKCPRLSARSSSPANGFDLDENALTESASGVRYSGLESVRRENVKGQAGKIRRRLSVAILLTFFFLLQRASRVRRMVIFRRLRNRGGLTVSLATLKGNASCRMTEPSRN